LIGLHGSSSAAGLRAITRRLIAADQRAGRIAVSLASDTRPGRDGPASGVRSVNATLTLAMSQHAAAQPFTELDG
jgi:hypothetical protein